METHVKLVAGNKKAHHDYFIEDTFECGIELFGTEVKSLRKGDCSLKESFIRIEKGQVYIYGMHVSPYEKGNIFNKDPLRVRRLLLHKKEILRLSDRSAEQGYTIVPLSVYFKGRLVKLEIALAKGKKLYDKRETLQKRRRSARWSEASEKGRRSDRTDCVPGKGPAFRQEKGFPPAESGSDKKCAGRKSLTPHIFCATIYWIII